MLFDLLLAALLLLLMVIPVGLCLVAKRCNDDEDHQE